MTEASRNSEQVYLLAGSDDRQSQIAMYEKVIELHERHVQKRVESGFDPATDPAIKDYKRIIEWVTCYVAKLRES